MSYCRKKRFDGNPGDTVFFDEMYQQTWHLWVVLTSPQGDTAKSVMVNLTSKSSHSDRTVVLHKGDHPFIEHATVVNYRAARFVNVDEVKKQIRNNMLTADYPFEPDVLKRIQDGILRSPWTRLRIKEYCAERL